MVADVTGKDANLKTIIHAISNSWKYQMLWISSLSIPFATNFLLRYVLPMLTEHYCLQKGSYFDSISTSSKALEQLHEVHIGSKKMQMLQAYTFWPGFSKDVDNCIHRCDACTIYQTRSDHPSLSPIAKLESAACNKILIDLKGPAKL